MTGNIGRRSAYQRIAHLMCEMVLKNHAVGLADDHRQIDWPITQRYGYSVAAAALAVFLGREFERNLRIGLQFYDQSWYEFFSRPITAITMAIALAVLVYGIVQQLRMRRRIRENLAATSSPALQK